MGVEFIDIGSHKNVYAVRFDKGDIFYTIGSSNKGRCFINFYTNDGTYKAEDFINKNIDETILPELSIVFSDPAQINGLVQMLMKVQLNYFE